MVVIYGGDIQPEWGGERFKRKESLRGRRAMGRVNLLLISIVLIPK
jgi:hypothetical protein